METEGKCGRICGEGVSPDSRNLMSLEMCRKCTPRYAPAIFVGQEREVGVAKVIPGCLRPC